MSELSDKIQEVIAMIEPCYLEAMETYEIEIDGESRLVNSGLPFIGREKFRKLVALADDIVLLAGREGLDHKLPQVENLRKESFYRNEPSDLVFATELNLPGYWDRLFYTLYPVNKWLTNLRTVAWLSAQKPTDGKRKRGRPSEIDNDKMIAAEYWDGWQAGRWGSQADYLRKKHPGKSASWLSQLLKRAGRRDG